MRRLSILNRYQALWKTGFIRHLGNVDSIALYPNCVDSDIDKYRRRLNRVVSVSVEPDANY